MLNNTAICVEFVLIFSLKKSLIFCNSEIYSFKVLVNKLIIKHSSRFFISTPLKIGYVMRRKNSTGFESLLDSKQQVRVRFNYKFLV